VCRPVSQGAEETFPRDLVSDAEMEKWIDRRAESVCGRLTAKGVCARTVAARVRYSDFRPVACSQTVRLPGFYVSKLCERVE
jgi:nucleotidyltransferase/DNA polymerase involved in DNA repair